MVAIEVKSNNSNTLQVPIALISKYVTYESLVATLFTNDEKKTMWRNLFSEEVFLDSSTPSSATYNLSTIMKKIWLIYFQ